MTETKWKKAVFAVLILGMIQNTVGLGCAKKPAPAPAPVTSSAEPQGTLVPIESLLNDETPEPAEETIAPAVEEAPDLLSEEVPEQAEEVMDMTFMSSTVIYSEVLNMMTNPEEYAGKTIRITGLFAIGEDDDGNPVVGCIIPDATQCCAQGVQFFWNGEHKFPDDYPQEGETITVEGVFDYKDAGYTILLMLKDADLWQGIQPRQD